MDWKTLLIALVPVLKPVLITAITAGAAVLGKALFNFIQHSHYAAVAKMIVSAIEDEQTKMDGVGKLALAVSKLSSKVGISEADAEDYIRAAYTNFIKPLDAIQSPLASSSTTGSATPVASGS